MSIQSSVNQVLKVGAKENENSRFLKLKDQLNERNSQIELYKRTIYEFSQSSAKFRGVEHVNKNQARRAKRNRKMKKVGD